MAVAARSGTSLTGALDAHARPRIGRAALDLGTSVVPYVCLLVAIYFSLRVSIVLALVLALPASGFLIRTFIVFHDCAHGSFLRGRRANSTLGTLLGFFVWLPFRSWQHEHAVHHASAGDLDRRGVGDVLTLTLSEYRARPWWGRLGYRLFRNPFVMFGLGWLLVLVLKPRFVARGASARIRRNVHATNLALVLSRGAACFVLGWKAVLLVEGPSLLIMGAVGIWLFYVQHQFEDTYWQGHEEWRYDEAALQGSSYLKLPRLLQFFTGNIGFHHVHHLSARIPNYNLQAAHDQLSELQAVPHLSLWQGIRATRLKLWDERRGRLISFREASLVRGAPESA
jgi:omega-6 fatty acid desaturase (delta-12 desaturase)